MSVIVMPKRQFGRNALAGCVAVSLVAFGLWMGRGVPAVNVLLKSGRAWLENASNGTVSLIDGFSGSRIGQARAANAPGRISVVNTASGAVVVDADGHVSRVDNASMKSGTPRTIFTNTAISADSNSIYAVDEARGLVQQLSVDGANLTPVGAQVDLKSQIGSAVVDGAGKLWAALPSKGELAGIQNGKSESVGGVASSGDDLSVVTASSRVVAVDLTSQTLTPIGFGHAVHLPQDDAADGQSLVVGSDRLPNVAIVGPRSVIAVNVTEGNPTSTPLPAAVTPTSPVMTGTTVALIDRPTGGVLLVDTQRRTVQPPITLADGRADQLVLKDGQIFVNDTTGPDGLVVHPDGSTSPISKYTDETTKQALNPPAPKRSTPPTSSLPRLTPPATPNPLAPPSTGSGGGTTRQQSGPPGTPGNFTAAPGNTTIDLSWTAATPHGAPIDVYRISWTGSDGKAHTKDLRPRAGASAFSYQIRDLSNGTPYLVAVAAHNRLGYGTPATKDQVTPSSAVPDPPTKVTASATGPNEVTVTWTAPDNGYRVAGFAVQASMNSGPAVQVASGIDKNATSAKLSVTGPLVVGVSTQFTVTAQSDSGATSKQSSPSPAVIPYGPPSPPAITGATSATDGTTASITVNCDSTCLQGGTVQSFAVQAAGPNGQLTGTANTTASTATVSISGLTPNTTYTVTSTVRTNGGTSTDSNPQSLGTTGPATVQTVSVSYAPDGRTLFVMPTVTGTALSTTCQASINGVSGPVNIACSGSSQVGGVPMWNTNYGVTVTAANSANPAPSSASGAGVSGGKPIVANATDAFGPDASPCPSGETFCGGTSHSFPSANYSSTNGDLQTEGTNLHLLCYMTGGGSVTGYGSYSASSTTWVKIAEDPGRPWMNVYYFSPPGSVTSGLPGC